MGFVILKMGMGFLPFLGTCDLIRYIQSVFRYCQVLATRPVVPICQSLLYFNNFAIIVYVMYVPLSREVYMCLYTSIAEVLMLMHFRNSSKELQQPRTFVSYIGQKMVS